MPHRRSGPAHGARHHGHSSATGDLHCHHRLRVVRELGLQARHSDPGGSLLRERRPSLAHLQPVLPQLSGRGEAGGGSGLGAAAGQCAQQALPADPPGRQEIEGTGEGLGAACKPSPGEGGCSSCPARLHCRGRAGRREGRSFRSITERNFRNGWWHKQP